MSYIDTVNNYFVIYYHKSRIFLGHLFSFITGILPKQKHTPSPPTTENKKISTKHFNSCYVVSVFKFTLKYTKQYFFPYY